MVRSVIALLAALSLLAPAASGAPAPPANGAPSPELIHPRLSWRATGFSAGLAGIGSLGARAIPVDRVRVPPDGLDRERIHWIVDRRSIRSLDLTARHWSDGLVTAAAGLPVFLALARSPRHPDLGGLGIRVAHYAEASLWTEACTAALKRSVARPRPTLYDLDGGGPIQPTVWDFQSMPSGHASRAWCAASFAIVDHLYSRPHAGFWEDAAIGLGAGALAGATSALRVRGGVHFPSDVLAGAGIGTACGAAVPLFHGYEGPGHRRLPAPQRRRWLTTAAATIAGAAAGTGLVVLSN